MTPEHSDRDGANGNPPQATANIDGMTVNERLVHLGLMHAFEAAEASGDAGALRQTLKRARLSDQNIEAIIDRVLKKVAGVPAADARKPAKS